jgi:hypothetical protein
MRKPKHVDDDGADAGFFDDFEADDFEEDISEELNLKEVRQRKKPARQRVEMRLEQLTLRRQLSDWEDYDQDDFDKL